MHAWGKNPVLKEMASGEEIPKTHKIYTRMPHEKKQHSEHSKGMSTVLKSVQTKQNYQKVTHETVVNDFLIAGIIPKSPNNTDLMPSMSPNGPDKEHGISSEQDLQR